MLDVAMFLFWLWTDLDEAGHFRMAEMVRRAAIFLMRRVHYAKVQTVWTPAEKRGEHCDRNGARVRQRGREQPAAGQVGKGQGHIAML